MNIRKPLSSVKAALVLLFSVKKKPTIKKKRQIAVNSATYMPLFFKIILFIKKKTQS